MEINWEAIVITAVSGIILVLQHLRQNQKDKCDRSEKLNEQYHRGDESRL